MKEHSLKCHLLKKMLICPLAVYQLRVLNKSIQHGQIINKAKCWKKIQINHTNYLYSLNEKKKTTLF